MHKTPGVLPPEYFITNKFFSIILGQKKHTLALRPLFIHLFHSNYKIVTTRCGEITSNRREVAIKGNYLDFIDKNCILKVCWLFSYLKKKGPICFSFGCSYVRSFRSAFHMPKVSL